MFNKKKWVVFLLFIVLFSSFVFAEDTDGDGLDDVWEEDNFGFLHGGDERNLTQTSTDDNDEDGLINLYEYLYDGDPNVKDTDVDGFSDYDEYYHLTDMIDDEDYPEKSLFNITLVSPKFGASKVSKFNLKIHTENSSECKRSTSPNEKFEDIENPSQIFTTSGEGKNHTSEITLTQGLSTKIYFYCKMDNDYNDDEGYKNDMFPDYFSLVVDTSSPKIQLVKAEPNPVIETIKVKLVAETDDESVCRFFTGEIDAPTANAAFNNATYEEFDTTSFVTLTETTTPAIEDEKHYEFVVYCKNRAEDPIVSNEIIAFDVNLSAPNKILEVTPSGYVSTATTEIHVITNRDSICRYGDNFLKEFYPAPDYAKDHYIEQTNLSSNSVSFDVICQFKDGETKETTVSFTIDRTPPTTLVINSDDETCDNETLNVSFSAQDNNQILKYVVQLLNSSNAVLFETETGDTKVELTDLNLKRNKDYFWNITVYDFSGNKLNKKTSGTSVLAADHETCQGKQLPYLELIPKVTELGIMTKLSCKADGGSCKPIYYAIKNSSCDSCGDCEFEKYISTKQLVFKETADLCYNITDSINQNVFSFFEIKYEDCDEENNESCCVSKQGSYCDDINCTLITNIECDPNSIDTDDDGILDIDEIGCGLDPTIEDADVDADNDTLTNKQECMVYDTDPFNADTDGDGFNDDVELSASPKTNPNDETDYPIDVNLDTDGDGITDVKEKECGLDPDKDDALDDDDDDGLSNKKECLNYKTKFNKFDTDGDGYSDGVEIEKGTDPTRSSDFPKSYTLNIILIIFGIAALVAGIFFFMKKSPYSPKGPKKTDKPLVDFNNAATELNQPVQQPRYVQPQSVIKKKVVLDKNNLDHEIRKKREELRFKKMSSVFDSFAEDKPREMPEKDKNLLNKLREKKVDEKRNENEKTFDRLNDISEEDAFEELEVLEKKEKKK